jgi:hypothetical protein
MGRKSARPLTVARETREKHYVDRLEFSLRPAQLSLLARYPLVSDSFRLIRSGCQKDFVNSLRR